MLKLIKMDSKNIYTNISISNKCCSFQTFYSSKNRKKVLGFPQKYKVAQLISTLKIRQVAFEQQISNSEWLAEDSCDSENWSAITGIN